MKKTVYNIVLFVLLIVFFGTTTMAVREYIQYKNEEKVYRDAAEIFTADAGSVLSEEIREEETQDEMQDEKICPIEVDFTALREINPDIIGWIYCEGTQINYPILYGKDNDQYIHRGYNGKELNAGSIFMESENRPDFSDANTIIYGHHMKNGSMFAALEKWKNRSFYEEHPYLWVLTADKSYKVHLFSGYTTQADSETYTIYTDPCEEMEKYCKKAVSKSNFKADDIPVKAGKCVVLSTCDYSFENARYVLHGVMEEI